MELRGCLKRIIVYLCYLWNKIDVHFLTSIMTLYVCNYIVYTQDSACYKFVPGAKKWYWGLDKCKMVGFILQHLAKGRKDQAGPLLLDSIKSCRKPKLRSLPHLPLLVPPLAGPIVLRLLQWLYNVMCQLKNDTYQTTKLCHSAF